MHFYDFDQKQLDQFTHTVLFVMVTMTVLVSGITYLFRGALGAAGNLIDRITAGYVVDFVDLYWSGWHFWAFNVADAAITVGVAFMVLDLLGAGNRHVSRAV